MARPPRIRWDNECRSHFGEVGVSDGLRWNISATSFSRTTHTM